MDIGGSYYGPCYRVICPFNSLGAAGQGAAADPTPERSPADKYWESADTADQHLMICSNSQREYKGELGQAVGRVDKWCRPILRGHKLKEGHVTAPRLPTQ